MLHFIDNNTKFANTKKVIQENEFGSQFNWNFRFT